MYSMANNRKQICTQRKEEGRSDTESSWTQEGKPQEISSKASDEGRLDGVGKLMLGQDIHSNIKDINTSSVFISPVCLFPLYQPIPVCVSFSPCEKISVFICLSFYPSIIYIYLSCFAVICLRIYGLSVNQNIPFSLLLFYPPLPPPINLLSVLTFVFVYPSLCLFTYLCIYILA